MPSSVVVGLCLAGLLLIEADGAIIRGRAGASQNEKHNVGFLNKGSPITVFAESSAEVEDGQPRRKRYCNRYKCPPMTVLKVGSHTIIGASTSACCDRSCALYTCPAGYAIVENADHIAGQSTDFCCDQTCAGYFCPSDSRPLPNLDSIIGNSDDDCCEYKSCSIYQCPPGMILRSGDDNLMGQTTSICCEFTCDTFTCPTCYDTLPNMSGFGANLANCCNPTPGCNPYATNATTPPPKPVPGWRAGDELPDPCDMACLTGPGGPFGTGGQLHGVGMGPWLWAPGGPLYGQPMPPGMNMTGVDTQQAMREGELAGAADNYLPPIRVEVNDDSDRQPNVTCNKYKCPSGMLIKTNAAQIYQSQPCCDYSCYLFTCPIDQLLRPWSKKHPRAGFRNLLQLGLQRLPVSYRLPAAAERKQCLGADHCGLLRCQDMRLLQLSCLLYRSEQNRWADRRRLHHR